MGRVTPSPPPLIACIRDEGSDFNVGAAKAAK